MVCVIILRHPPNSPRPVTLFPYTTLVRSAQIVIDFESELDSSNNELISIDSITNVTITPPDTIGVVMNIYTGIISPSTTIVDTPINMPVSGLTCQQILLPLEFSEGLNLSFTLYLEGSTNPSNYVAQIVLVDNKLEAGNSYNYTIEVKQSEDVVVSNVNVKNWTQVDENNKPIVPVLK